MKTKEVAPATVSRRPSMKGLLDVSATVLLILTCVTLLWSRWNPPSASTKARGADVAAASALDVPNQLLDLTGAEVKGDKSASIVVVEFSEFKCPFCGSFARDTFPLIEKEYISKGKVLWAFRHLPLTSLHPEALRVAVSASCAGSQGKFWPVHDWLFRNQKLANGVLPNGIFTEADPALYAECLSGSGADRVRKDMALAAELGISGTPTFLIGTINKSAGGTFRAQRRLAGARPFEAFESVFESLEGTIKR